MLLKKFVLLGKAENVIFFYCLDISIRLSCGVYLACKCKLVFNLSFKVGLWHKVY